jgi:ABC-type transport system substrate-binding protein
VKEKVGLKIFVIIAYFILQIGCKDKENTIDRSKVFIYNQPANITSLDPAFAKSHNNMWVVNHVFNTLIKLDNALVLTPGLAKSWQISEDGLSYTFNLRNDVYFHENECFKTEINTRKLTAYDVEYSLNRLVDTTLASPGSWLFSDKIDNASGFKAVNDTIFQLKLKAPFLPTLQLLTMQYCSVVPREAVEVYGSNFRANPIGSGPYKFKRWLDNQAVFLIKNEKYYDQKYFADGAPEFIKTTLIPDKQIAALELLNGNIDMISGLESSYINEFLDRDGKLKDDKSSKINYYRSPYLNTEYIGINQELAQSHPGLKNKYFRQALNYAIDRNLLLQSLRNGVGQPANSGFTPKGLPSFNDSIVVGYSYNIEKAKALLVKSGIPNVNKLPPIKIHTNADYLDLATFVAKQWERLGINTTIELMDTGILRDGMRNSKLQLFRASWIADYPDAESYLCVFYSKNPAPPNYTRFKNDNFDRLYEKSIRTVDEQERFELYQQMERIVIEEAPLIFLFYDESSIFLNNKVKGFKNNGLNILNLNGLAKNE